MINFLTCQDENLSIIAHNQARGTATPSFTTCMLDEREERGASTSENEKAVKVAAGQIFIGDYLSSALQCISSHGTLLSSRLRHRMSIQVTEAPATTDRGKTLDKIGNPYFHFCYASLSRGSKTSTTRNWPGHRARTHAHNRWYGFFTTHHEYLERDLAVSCQLIDSDAFDTEIESWLSSWCPPVPLGQNCNRIKPSAGLHLTPGLIHALTEPDEFCGMYIPGGSWVIANIWYFVDIKFRSRW